MRTFGVVVFSVLFPMSVAAHASADQPVSEHIVLVDGRSNARTNTCKGVQYGRSGHGFFRVYADGTRAKLPFTVPSGFQFVATDIEWAGRAYGPKQFSLDVDLRTSIYIGSGDTFQTVYRSSVAAPPQWNGDARGAKNDYTSTGFAVAPNTYICPTLRWYGQGGHPLGNNGNFEYLILRGHLVKDVKNGSE